MHRPALTAVFLAFAAASACRGRERIDTHTVIPLVARGADPANAQGAARDAGPRAPGSRHANRAVRYIEGRPAPDGALGVQWGMSRAAVAERNRAATVECRDSREYTFCRRALVEVPIPVVVTYEFCGEGLCAVSVDGPSTREEPQMNANYDALLAMVRASLGDPSDEARRAGAGCAGHLALCFASKQAELAAHWTWHDGPEVQLSVDQDEGDAFHAIAAVTWFSAERARRQDPADDPSPSPAIAATDGGSASDAR